MKSSHRILFGDAANLEQVPDETIEAVVTSPPYPMIEMWDDTFCSQSPAARRALENADGPGAFEAMHAVLDKVWSEVFRVLKPNGFACINIGDATRTIDKNFALYPNHARILSHCLALGFTNLPAIIWRKQTNAPNKFMGSGMLPAGAYVTLEHEYVLILRKGGKREFHSPEEKARRARSALFWEERNTWFSDVWMDLKGTTQNMKAGKSRNRSGAYPFELAYRLVNMYSVRGDTVLDPFLGTGTTTLSSMASNRNSVGVEIEKGLTRTITERITEGATEFCNAYIRERIEKHLEFVKNKEALKGRDAFKYANAHFGFKVTTRQEVDLMLNYLKGYSIKDNNEILVEYAPKPTIDYYDEDSLFGSVDRVLNSPGGA